MTKLNFCTDTGHLPSVYDQLFSNDKLLTNFMLEYEIYDRLEDSGFNTAEYKLFKLDDELKAGSYPVVLKIASPKVIHKTDVGAVIVDINDEEKLNEAKNDILLNLKKHGIKPDQQDRFLVTKEYKGIELFFGIINDPVFEKVIVFGAGGIFTELFKDICFIDSEADEGEIEQAIIQTKIGSIFTKGFRGQQYDIDLVKRFIKKLQQLEVQELDLNPVILSKDSLIVVDGRLLPLKSAVSHKELKFLPEIFSPQKIAIIGVSGHSDKVGYALAKNASKHSNIYFVNPKLKVLFDKKVFNCIEYLPEIDTAVLAIPSVAINETIEKLISKKVKNIIIITAGFKEAGKDENFLSHIAETLQLNIIGPNCIGMYANGINLTFGTSDIQNGAVNFFSQSGAIVAELMDKAALNGKGFENIVSVGNMADVDFADLINSYAGNNPINLYVEGISNGKNLLRAVRKSRSRIKMFKAGKSEVARKAAFSHTGNMAGNYEMFVGLLENAGAKMVREVNGLLYPYDFKNILVITNAGGAGTVLSDLISDKLYLLNEKEIEKLDKVLPSNWSKNNPVDIIGDACHERYFDALKVVDEFGADAIYVIVTPQFMTDPHQISKIFIENKFKTKIFPILLGGEMMEIAKADLKKNKIEFFEELSEAVSFL